METKVIPEEFANVQITLKTKREAYIIVNSLTFSAENHKSEDTANEIHQMAMQIAEACGL